MKYLDKYWRIIASGFCFFVFGASSLIGEFTILPLIALMPVKKEIRHRWTRLLIKFWFRCFVWFSTTLRCYTIDATQTKYLNTSSSTLVIANHPSLMDVVLLIAYMPPTSCIVKSALFRNPFTAIVMRCAGYIRNDDPTSMVKKCCDVLEAKEHLIIFPEGTRSIPGKPLNMKRGTAHILLESKALFIPVVVHCNPVILAKTMRWYQVPETIPRYILATEPAINIHDFIDTSAPRPTAVREITHWLESYFAKALES